MKLAIKKPQGVFWKTDLNHEDIHQMLEAGKITEEWLICGQGEAKDAVLISEFLADPSKLKPCQNPQKVVVKTKEPDWNVLLPWFALAYIPMVFLVCFLSTDGFILFAYSGFALLVLIPLYAIVIGKLTAKRIKRGTNTAKITLFQIFSLGVLIFWFLFVVNFDGSPV